MKITVGRSFRIREFETYRVEFLEVEIAEGKDPIEATEELGKMCLEARDRYLRLEREQDAKEEFVPASESPVPSGAHLPPVDERITVPQIEAIESVKEQLGDEGTRIVRAYELPLQRDVTALTQDEGKELIGELNAANRAKRDEAEEKLS